MLAGETGIHCCETEVSSKCASIRNRLNNPRPFRPTVLYNSVTILFHMPRLSVLQLLSKPYSLMVAYLLLSGFWNQTTFTLILVDGTDTSE
jgi:hypothetical protein